MSLEAYTGKISDLVDSNPTPTDPKSQGDDHLRGIKYTLKQTFPNFDGPTTQFPGQVTPNEITIGRNADQSKNFKITVPSPEDGTLTIERANGTDVLVVAADGKVTFPGNPSLPFVNIVFNGQVVGPAAPAIGYGIATITRNSTGAFTLAFSESQSNANYVAQVTAYNSQSGIIGTVSGGSASQISLTFYDAAGALANPGQVNVTIWKV